MEGQYIPGGEPPKVRARKPKTRDPAVDLNQGTQGIAPGQQPPVRKSNRAPQQHQPPPEAAGWDGYGNADPAQAYPEHYDYDYGDGQYVEAHGYGYGGAQPDAHQGYGYGDAGQGYGYADAGQGYGYADAGHGYGYGDAGQGYGYADAGQGYGYGGAQGDGGQEYGYVAPTQHKEKPKKTRKPKPAADGAYQGDGYAQPVRGSYEGSYGNEYQVDAHGQPLQDGYAYPEAYNAAPDPKAHNREASKSHKPSRVKSLEKRNQGDGAYVNPGNDAYAQHGEPSYGESGMVPAAGANPKPRVQKKGSQYDDFPVQAEGTPHSEGAVTSRAVTRVQGEHDGNAGSARSRTSQEGSHGAAPGRSKSSDREGSGSNRAKPRREGSGSGSGSGRVRGENETRSSREGLTASDTPRPNPVAKDGSGRTNPEQRRSRSKEKVGSEGKTPEVTPPSLPPPLHTNPNPNPLHEHLRNTGAHSKPKPAYNDMSMVVFHDPNDRTLIDVKSAKPEKPKESPKPAPARADLHDWVKKQSELSGGNNVNQHESMIVMADDNKELLETRIFGAPLAKKQTIKLPPVVETVDRPQYQPRGDNNQYQPVVEKPLYQPVQRRPYANSPQLPSNEPHMGEEGGAIEAYDAQGKQIQRAEPNAKCMACIHNIGVPLARVATRIACVQCRRAVCGCTIL